MAQYLINDTTLTNIAGGIRSINDSTDNYTPSQMITELNNMKNEVENQTDLIIDLIAAINNLPNASEAGDLEALGVLCSWDVMTNDSSYPVITIYNRHPTYYLKCTIYNSDGIVADFDDGSGTAATGGVVTVSPDDWATFIIEDTFIDNDSQVYIDNVRWTKNA